MTGRKTYRYHAQSINTQSVCHVYCHAVRYGEGNFMKSITGKENIPSQ